MPSFRVSRSCCRRALSWKVTLGNRPRSIGDGELLGDEEIPLPSRFVITMKYLRGSRARPSPTMKVSMSLCVPVYHVGISTTLSRVGLSVPMVL